MVVFRDFIEDKQYQFLIHVDMILIYLGFDLFSSMVYRRFTIYISMFSTLLGMF